MDNVTTISGQSSVGAAGDGSIELVTAFCEAAITGKPAPNLVEEAYYSSVLGLLGLQAIDEGRVITFPDEYKIPYLNLHDYERDVLSDKEDKNDNREQGVAVERRQNNSYYIK